jgi:hypothetical protein
LQINIFARYVVETTHSEHRNQDILRNVCGNMMREPVKITVIAIVVLLSAFAAADPNPADYTASSRLDIGYGGKLLWRHQMLHVVIDGKKYERQSVLEMGGVLALGDYKAKLVKDQPRGSDSLQVYEFLFPDKKTRQFRVGGLTE